MAASRIIVVPLEARHTQMPFGCGDADLDDFLRDDALPAQQLGTARTYVAIDVDADAVRGYASVLTDTVYLKSSDLRKLGFAFNYPYNIPAVKLARLAIAENCQGQYLGRTLVGLVAMHGLTVSDTVGCRLLTVDAYPKSLGFYKKLGFVPNKLKTIAGREPANDILGPGDVDYKAACEAHGIAAEELERFRVAVPVELTAPVGTVSMRLDLGSEDALPRWLADQLEARRASATSALPTDVAAAPA